MKIHCHLCGARLRRPDEYGLLRRADTGDEIVVCTDVVRCDGRIAADPLGGTGKRPHEARAASILQARGLRAGKPERLSG